MWSYWRMGKLVLTTDYCPLSTAYCLLQCGDSSGWVDVVSRPFPYIPCMGYNYLLVK